MPISFSGFSSDTIENAITRGDDYFLLEGEVRTQLNLPTVINFDTAASIKAMAIGGFSAVDMVDVVFSQPVRGTENEPASPYDSVVRVGVKSPFFGRVPINGFLGETVEMRLQPASGSAVGPGSWDHARAAFYPNVQLICYLNVPPWVNRERAPIIISRYSETNDDVTFGPLWTLGRRTVKIRVANTTLRNNTVAVTISHGKYFRTIGGTGGAEGTVSESYTLAVGATSAIEWSRSDDYDMPDYVQVNVVGTDISPAIPLLIYMEARD